MTFTEKLKEVTDLIVENNQWLKGNDNNIDDIGAYLSDYVDGWPILAVIEDGDIDAEEVNTENCYIDVYEHYIHVCAGGDWQPSTDFDIILNINEKSEKPFVACNIVSSSDLNLDRIGSSDPTDWYFDVWVSEPDEINKQSLIMLSEDGYSLNDQLRSYNLHPNILAALNRAEIAAECEAMEATWEVLYPENKTMEDIIEAMKKEGFIYSMIN